MIHKYPLETGNKFMVQRSENKTSKIAPEVDSFKSEKRKYYYLGLIFLTIQILAIIRNISFGELSFFWYCDFTPGVFAFLFFLKADQAIKGLLSIGLFIQLTYGFQLLSKILFGVSLFGFVFNFTHPFYIAISIVLHITTMIVLISEFKIKPTEKSLFYSLLFLVLIYIMVIVVIPQNQAQSANYNLVYYSKELSPYVENYTQIWIPIAFFIVVLPAHIFQTSVYYLYSRRRKRARYDKINSD